MAAPSTDLAPRKFGRPDAARSTITLVVLAITFVAWMFLLPRIQSAIIPSAAGGATGPWVVRPIFAMRLGACAIASAVSVPLLSRRLQKRWNAQDTAAGTMYAPYLQLQVLRQKVIVILRTWPVARGLFIVWNGSLMLVYAGILLFYLLSWSTIGPTDISVHLPWGGRSYAFDQVTSLETIPGPMRSVSLRQDGPWYSVRFSDGTHLTLSPANEGLSETELTKIAAHIAKQSGRTWQVRPDARPR